MKKLKRTLFVVMVLLLFVLVACGGNESTDAEKEENAKEVEGNLTDSGMPIVNDPIELDFFTSKSGTTNEYDWNELFLWNEYADMTNIKINWTDQVHMDSLSEKVNLALASGSLPDVFYASGISTIDLDKYGQQGSFIELNDLIDEHAPNLKAFLDENPNVLSALTFPNGKIYSMPSLQAEDFLSIRIGAMPWYNKDWLETLEMDIPETTDEYYEYLKAVKTENPSGDPNLKETPYGGTSMNHMVG